MTYPAAQDPYEAETLEDRQIPLHGPEGFEGMRKAGRLAAELLDYLVPLVVPGVATGELDRLIEAYMRDHGAIPATLGYKGYPACSCISINHVVCHGIPGEKRLMDGDIVNIDVTYEAMMRGIAAVKPGARLGDVGHAIQSFAEGHRFSVVRDFCGHGLGQVFHAPPSVLHYGRPGTGPLLRPGMFFTIEPMINAGKYDVKVLDDGWTAVTRDRSLSAQFEHSIGVTDTGIEIFTSSPAGLDKPPYEPKS